MNEQLEKLFAEDPDRWISALPQYQEEIIRQLMKSDDDPDSVAGRWLKASGPSNTFPYGASKPESVFFNKLVEEMEALLCGSERYEQERATFLSNFNTTHVYVVSAISAAIAPAVGAAAPVIAPAVALALVTAGRMGLNAWCATRKAAAARETETGGDA